jgi:hypothetical protein
MLSRVISDTIRSRKESWSAGFEQVSEGLRGLPWRVAARCDRSLSRSGKCAYEPHVIAPQRNSRLQYTVPVPRRSEGGVNGTGARQTVPGDAAVKVRPGLRVRPGSRYG